MATGYEQQRERIVESFEQNKLELQTAVRDLTESMKGRVQEVRYRVDLRHQIGDHPLPWLAGSFGIGLLLGTRKWIGRTLRRAGF